MKIFCFSDCVILLHKIKDRLLVEEKRIEAFELRKNREQNRKFNKQVSEIRKQEKTQDRKAHNDEVSKIRKTGDKDEKEGRLNKILEGAKGGPAQKSRKREGMVRTVSLFIIIFIKLCVLFRTRSMVSAQRTVRWRR
jgi:hypothetical protein